MTITPFVIYLISLADSIENTLAIIFGITILNAIIISVNYVITLNELFYKETIKEEKEKYKKTIKKIAYIASLLLVLGMFTPDTKTLIAMYLIPPIANNVNMQKLPDNFINFLNKWMDKNEKK